MIEFTEYNNCVKMIVNLCNKGESSMKLKKRLALVLALLAITTNIPVITMAASTMYASKVVTAEYGECMDTTIVIDVKDETTSITTNQVIYISITGAHFDTDRYTIGEELILGEGQGTIAYVDQTELGINMGKTINRVKYSIPIIAKDVSSNEVLISVDGSSTMAINDATVVIGKGVPKEEVINFNDENFKRALIDNGVDINNDGEITTEEMKRIRSLDISKLNIRDISEIRYATNLVTLHIGWNKISDITPLYTLTKLESLRMNDCKIDNIEVLRKLSSLKILSVTGNIIEDMSPISSLAELQELYMNGCELTNLNMVKGLNRLRVLNAGYNPFKDISGIASLEQLGSIYLKGCNLTDLSDIQSLSNLYSLDVSNNKISNIEALSNLHNLKSLDLGENLVEDINAIRELINLEYLRIPYNPLKNVKALANLTQLESLYMWECGISDITPLMNMNELKHLNIGGNKVKDITSISQLTQMESLTMWECDVEDIKILSNLVNLKHLNIGGNKINSIEPILKLSQLESLYIFNCDLKEIDFVREFKELKTLNIANNYLDIIDNSATMQLIQSLLNRGVSVEYTPQLQGEKSNNAKLSSITLSHGTLMPNFNTQTLNYKVEVENSIESITINAIAEHEKAQVIGLGEKTLAIGNNIISVLVRAEDGTECTYNISVNRKAAAASGGSSGSGGGGGTIPSVSQNIEQIVSKLSETEKKDIAKRFNEALPYTRLSGVLSLNQLKELTNNKFTDKELQAILDKPDSLKELGIDINAISQKIALIPIKDAIFNDVSQEHWANSSIRKAADLGLVAGMPNGTFEPSSPLQVADTFTFLDRVLLLNGVTEMKLSKSIVEKYITNKEHWAFYNMASIGSKLSEETLVAITELKDDMISRQLLAQVLYEITDGKLKVVKEAVEFEDVQQSPYQKAIRYCIETGLLNGVSQKKMLPQKALTRAELMTVLIRLNEVLKVN